MTQEEMREEFYALYNMMANSQKVENMRTFGNVHREMMEWMIQNKPDLAEEWIGKLESIRWNNYLTPKEAQKIVDNMNPKAPWSRDVWRQAMNQLGIPTDDEPYYNSCALWVEMNKEYSDQGETVAELIGMPLGQIPADKIVPAMYKMAVNLLKDKDKVYDIRSYFKLLPMSAYKAMMRKKLLDEIYDKMSDDDKKLFVRLTMEDKNHKEILSALESQKKDIEEIRKSQSFWLDFSSNVAGNAVFDGAVWLFAKLFKKL